MRLSVIIIAKNEALNIEACLDSVAFADEWIVVESGSTDAAVHERVVPTGPVGHLKSHFDHAAYDSLDELLTKINRYSSDAAAMMHARGKRTSVAGIIGHAVWTFIRIYIIRRGFLDGRHGFVLAGAAAAGSFFRYSKLMFLSQRRK